MTAPLKILFLEDDPYDAEIVQRLLLKAHPNHQVCHVTHKKDFLFQLDAFHPDIVLSDNNLPKFSGGEALTLLREHSPFIPFILVTGTLSDELAVNIIQSGADDYILKDRL